MKSTLLIVSPQASFGTSIRTGLDPARFEVFSTSDFSDAIHYVRENNIPVVILDAELEGQALSVIDIGFALRQIKPDVHFVLVVRAEQNVETETLVPDATLVKPVSISDLETLIENLALQVSMIDPMDSPMPDFNPTDRQVEGEERLQWLGDVSKAAQQLTQLTLESSAQAAFITCQNELWAYAGQLSREAAQELTDSIQRYLDKEGQSDLLRFVRLKATDAQHMLYVRKLSEKMTLALVFDAETPYSTIRSQAGKLVKNLIDNSMAQSRPGPSTVTDQIDSQAVSAEQPETADFQDVPLISELLGEVPPPIPPRPSLKINLPWDQPELETKPASSTAEQPSVARPEEAPRRPVPALDETMANPLPASSAVTQINIPKLNIPDDLAVTRKQAVRMDPESMAETRAQGVGEGTPDGAHRILIEPPSLSQVNLTYACLLIPRFEHHHLVGDVATRLNEWVPQLCVAFGWRLEYISVRPDYLQWIARVPLNTAAGYVIRIIRQHTSDRFFAEFPRFKVDNPSGEFWAPGFIVQGGSQTHPPKQVREFIKQTRVRQGLR